MNGARLFAECLVKHGVRYIFGIPGAKIDALFDALLDTPIKLILCHHEQNAAFMAALHGRLTGKPGVALVTSGPGVSNLITGLLTATTEGDPLIAIGGNVPRSMKLKQSHQSTNNVRITMAATKNSVEISLAQNIPEVIDNAFRIAQTPRSGAVFISLPQDVLFEETSATPNRPVPPISFGATSKALIDQAAVLISRAKNPAFLLGLEASRPENTAAIRAFLHKTRIAAVNTYQAAGTLSRDLMDCFVGRVGLFKNQPGDTLLDRADLIITVGYGPVEYDPEIWNAGNSKRPIIHIDYIPAQIHSTYTPSLELLGSISENLTLLSERLPSRKKLNCSEEVKKLQQKLEKSTAIKLSSQKKSLIHPLAFISDLQKVVDDETFVLSDIGTHYMWLAHYFFTHNPHQLLFSNGQQTLGVALPWAIATRLLYPKRKIISISGDGGFFFSAMELETAVREHLPLVHCIWCDGSYDMVKQQQVMKYQRESVVSFGSIDFVKFAESFGAVGFRVNSPKELLPLLKRSLSLDRPVILEIPIDYSDNAPLFKNSLEAVRN